MVIGSEAEALSLLGDAEFLAHWRRECWFGGDLSDELRPHGQKWLHEFISKTRTEAPGPLPIVIEMHRRIGKSHFLLMLLVEMALRHPGSRFIYALPEKEDVDAIVVPNMEIVLETCPGPLKPRFSKNRYFFKNPRWGRHKKDKSSVIEAGGLNWKRDFGRGGGCDGFVVDEAGFIKPLHLTYWVESVAGPQFMGRKKRTGVDPFAIMSSTPPPSMDHPYITKYIPQAIAQDRYFGLKGSQNPDFSEEDKRIIRMSVGPKDSIAYRREIELEHISDIERLLIPEYLDVREEITVKRDRPDMFYTWVSLDGGYQDATHALFAYIDFYDQVLVIEQEMRVVNMSPGKICAKGKALEETLWPKEDQLAAPKRIADLTPLELAGFRDDHKWSFSPADKHDADTTLARLRTGIQERKIMIHPRCTNLIYQLENCIWNEKRTDIERSASGGHADGIKALAYLWKKCQTGFRRNPFPTPPRDRGTFYVSDSKPDTTPAVAKAFRP